MPTGDEENADQPVWKSVLLFACKGMIEGIIVLLFLWLLIQVLFTKNLEVHLQILLSVGLAIFCFSLILGCVLCWRKTRCKPPEDKKDVTSPPPPDSVNHITLASSPSHSSGITFTKLQYEELEGEVFDSPSAFASSTPSDEELTCVVSEVNKHKSCFQMRRLSSPTISSSLYRPMASGRSSLPSLPKLNLLSKTRKVLERHCTVDGDGYAFSEHKRLTIPSPGSPSHLLPYPTQGLLGEEPLLMNYGSNLHNETLNLSLHFTLTYSSTLNTVTVSLVSITGGVHSLEGVTVHAWLLPPCLGPLDMSTPGHGLSSGLQEKNLVVNVGSLEGLKSCVLRLAVFTPNLQSPKMSLLGEVEVKCSGLDWVPDRPVSCVRELRQAEHKTEKVTL